MAATNTQLSSHALAVLQRIHTQQLHGQHCDISVKVGGDTVFKAHKTVLAAASPYFHAMFSDGMIESYSDTVTIQDILPSVFQVLLHFMYTGK